jgi:hypothetical protein
LEAAEVLVMTGQAVAVVVDLFLIKPSLCHQALLILLQLEQADLDLAVAAAIVLVITVVIVCFQLLPPQVAEPEVVGQLLLKVTVIHMEVEQPVIPVDLVVVVAILATAEQIVVNVLLLELALQVKDFQAALAFVTIQVVITNIVLVAVVAPEVKAVPELTSVWVLHNLTQTADLERLVIF